MSRVPFEPDPADSSAHARVSRATGFSALYRKLNGALKRIERTENVAQTLELILDALVEGFRDELGFEGGRVYKRGADGYSLCCGFGTSRDVPVGLRVPPDYPPHLRTLEEGLLIMRRGDPGYDEVFERSIGVESTFAAIAVGKENRYIIAFSISGEVREEHVLYSLTAVRHVINLKLEQQKHTDMLKESRAIQESMLPAGPPEFPGYDIDGLSRPAEIVGGDVFDYLPLADEVLGVAVADASGHGLPAALIARDVITGLRSLASDGSEVSGIIGRLNRVIHRAALSSKFVSLFYGQLAADGTLVYCNAGHNPPLLQRSDSCLELMPGGPVLGPIPNARYEVGEVRLGPGDTLFVFTDGLVERGNRAGEPFGASRLREVLEASGGASARELVGAVYIAVDRHAGEVEQRDDMTVVVVRKT